MAKLKAGQVVKFHSPLPNENPNQIYVVLEAHYDVDKPRAHIRALIWGQTFLPINVVLCEDLISAQIKTGDIMGRNVTVVDNCSSLIFGKVIGIYSKEIKPKFIKTEKGILTNLSLKIMDNLGMEHHGKLIVT
ncbi:MAG: hypothetical protein PHE56_07875 [Bacteroidales bacterium]|nr:hypothetical protein [Bacteroidales bacterium]